MKFIDRLLGKQDRSNYNEVVYGIQLENETGDEMPPGKKVAKNPSDSMKRIKKDQLQMIYYRDDIAYNGVNQYTRLLMSSPLRWVCEDEEDQMYMDAWTENTNMYGVVYDIVKNALIFGIGWAELLWAKKDGKNIFVRLDSIDSKTMDFMRSNSGSILYTPEGFPQGYVQLLPMSTQVDESRRSNDVAVYGGVVQKLNDDEVAYFSFETLSGGVEGVGIIEPQYDTVRRKKSIEKGHAQSVLRRGNTRYHIQNGNEKYRPNPNERERVKTELESLKPQDDIVTEWWTKIDVLEAQEIGSIDAILKYYVARQASCMGLPLPYVTEEGEDTNRSTLADQKVLLFMSIDSMKKRFVKQFERQIVPYIMQNRDFKSRPVLVWDDLSMDDKESRSLRLQRYAKAGLLTPTKDIEEDIRGWEGLDTEWVEPEPEIKEAPKEKKQEGEVKENG